MRELVKRITHSLERNDDMPTVHVTLLEGRTRELRRELIVRITDVVEEVAGTPRDGITVILHEVAAEDYGRGGVTIADRRAAAPSD